MTADSRADALTPLESLWDLMGGKGVISMVMKVVSREPVERSEPPESGVPTWNRPIVD